MKQTRSTASRSSHRPWLWSTALAAPALLWAPYSAQAANVVGGSDLLDAIAARQLETWLGAGPIALTNVFDKVAGNTSADFHAAADGKGATFSVIEVTGYRGVAFDTPVLVGGYNPQSWYTGSGTGYNVTPNDADRTAFVFNLTQGLMLTQRHDSATDNRGYYQTRNFSHLGPTFGAGYDLYVDQSLNIGDSFLYSYGADADFGLDLTRYPQRGLGSLTSLNIGQIEVFTVTSVPEPETWALMLVGLVGLRSTAKRRPRTHQSARATATCC